MLTLRFAHFAPFFFFYGSPGAFVKLAGTSGGPFAFRRGRAPHVSARMAVFLRLFPQVGPQGNWLLGRY